MTHNEHINDSGIISYRTDATKHQLGFNSRNENNTYAELQL